MTGITGLTGKPPRPSSTDEQSSLAPLRPYQAYVPQPHSEEHRNLLLNQFHLTFDVHGQKLPQFQTQISNLTSHDLYVGDDEE